MRTLRCVLCGFLVRIAHPTVCFVWFPGARCAPYGVFCVVSWCASRTESALIPQKADGITGKVGENAIYIKVE